MSEKTLSLVARLLALVFVGVLAALPAIAAAQDDPPALPPAPKHVPPSDPPSPSPVPTPSEPPAATPSPAPRPATSIELATRATSGIGMYVWRWQKAGGVASVVERAKAAKINFLVVRASSQSQGVYLGDILNDLLPKAHAAGIKVVGYDPPRFEDVAADARRAVALINYRTPTGHGIDAFGADIEPAWNLLTPQNAERYGFFIRDMIGARFPLVAIVYPPNQVGSRVPYAQIAQHFDVLSPMSYWRAKTVDGKTFMAASVEQLKAYGKPVSAIGQAFAYSGHPQVALRAFPPKPEFDAAVASARSAGAIGMSFWVWETAEPWVFDSLRDAAWPAIDLPPGVREMASAAVAAPKVRAPAPTAAPTPVAPSPDPRVRAQAFGPGAVPVKLPVRQWWPMLIATLALAFAAAASWRKYPVPMPADGAVRVKLALRGAPERMLKAVESATAPLVAMQSTATRKSSRSARGARSSRPAATGRPRVRAGKGSS
jgi:hypothetical protein